MEHNNKPTLPRFVRILLPIFLVILCAGVTLLAMIHPYNLAKTYLRIAFMDSSATTVTEAGTAGLNILETDIDTNYTGQTYDTGDTVVSDYGSQCAILEADSIDLYVPVYWGGGTELLEMGACQTPASAILGASGNSVISAHVNTFFNRLDELDIGDTVTAYTTYGRFTYEVAEKITFDASEKKYLKNTDDDRLTLYTCEMQLLGSSSTRIGVICTLTDREFYAPATEEETP